MQRGRTDSLGASADDLRESLGKLGDGNMQKRGLSWGRLEHGNDAGSQDAVYSKVTLVAGRDVYEVRHTLGHVPGFIRLIDSENTITQASHYSVIPWDKRRWTENTAFVRVYAMVGNLAGGSITLHIGGEG